MPEGYAPSSMGGRELFYRTMAGGIPKTVYVNPYTGGRVGGTAAKMAGAFFGTMADELQQRRLDPQQRLWETAQRLEKMGGGPTGAPMPLAQGAPPPPLGEPNAMPFSPLQTADIMGQPSGTPQTMHTPQSAEIADMYARREPPPESLVPPPPGVPTEAGVSMPAVVSYPSAGMGVPQVAQAAAVPPPPTGARPTAVEMVLEHWFPRSGLTARLQREQLAAATEGQRARTEFIRGPETRQAESGIVKQESETAKNRFLLEQAQRYDTADQAFTQSIRAARQQGQRITPEAMAQIAGQTGASERVTKPILDAMGLQEEIRYRDAHLAIQRQAQARLADQFKLSMDKGDVDSARRVVAAERQSLDRGIKEFAVFE